MDNFVVGVVVLYNPEYECLKRLLKSIDGQVGKIIFVDNSEGGKSESAINKIISSQDSSLYEYISLRGNEGIAKAQNIGIIKAEEHGATHVLLLDQDSILPKKLVENLLNDEVYLKEQGIKVGAIGPAFSDEKTGKLTGAVKITPLYKRNIHNTTARVCETDYLIASGSLIKISALAEIGLMDEDLFIDLVDIEWCERCRILGFHCFVSMSVVLQHSIGTGFKTMLGKNVIIHNDIRHYYIVRNTLHVLLRKKMNIKHKVYLTLRMPLFLVTHVLTSNKRIKKIKILSSAICDGLYRRMGKKDL